MGERFDTYKGFGELERQRVATKHAVNNRIGAGSGNFNHDDDINTPFTVQFLASGFQIRPSTYTQATVPDLSVHELTSDRSVRTRHEPDLLRQALPLQSTKSSTVLRPGPDYNFGTTAGTSANYQVPSQPYSSGSTEQTASARKNPDWITEKLEAGPQHEKANPLGPPPKPGYNTRTGDSDDDNERARRETGLVTTETWSKRKASCEPGADGTISKKQNQGKRCDITTVPITEDHVRHLKERIHFYRLCGESEDKAVASLKPTPGRQMLAFNFLDPSACNTTKRASDAIRRLPVLLKRTKTSLGLIIR